MHRAEDYYNVVEEKIRRGTVKLAELRHLLVHLEDEGLLTTAEHERLLHLAEGMSAGQETEDQS